jgi:hypothetical protein
MRQHHFLILVRKHSTFIGIAFTTHGLKVFNLIFPARMSGFDVVLSHQNQPTIPSHMVEIEMRGNLTYWWVGPMKGAPVAFLHETVDGNFGRVLNRSLQLPD